MEPFTILFLIVVGVPVLFVAFVVFMLRSNNKAVERKAWNREHEREMGPVRAKMRKDAFDARQKRKQEERKEQEEQRKKNLAEIRSHYVAKRQKLAVSVAREVLKRPEEERAGKLESMSETSKSLAEEGLAILEERGETGSKT